jgi:parallel beta-helix repeat protein
LTRGARLCYAAPALRDQGNELRNFRGRPDRPQSPVSSQIRGGIRATSPPTRPERPNVSLSENQVSNYARGIILIGPQCTGDGGCVLKDNVVQDNFGQNNCVGIEAAGTTGYTLTRNVASFNGAFPSCFPGGGIGLTEGSTGNVVTRNNSSNNRGLGIAVGPDTNGNLFTNNIARGNIVADLFAFPGTENTWLDNNRCNSESGAVPPSVCNPGE